MNNQGVSLDLVDQSTLAQANIEDKGIKNATHFANDRRLKIYASL